VETTGYDGTEVGGISDVDANRIGVAEENGLLLIRDAVAATLVVLLGVEVNVCSGIDDDKCPLKFRASY
jgi:hypothetical protein